LGERGSNARQAACPGTPLLKELTLHLLFVTHYYEPGAGEAAIRMARLARYLHQRGHRITVLTTLPHYPKGIIDPAYRGKLWTAEDRDGIRAIYCWLWATQSTRISRRLLSQMSFMPLAMLRGLGIPRPDVTYIEAQPIFTGLVGRALSRLKGVPYVLNVSDLWPDHMLTVGALRETDTAYRIARAAMDSGYRGAAAITSMSPAWSRKVVEYIGGQAEKVHTIYRGVDTALFHPQHDTRDFRAKYGLGDGKLVTFIGTFATQYDFEALFAAAAHFQSRADVRFVIIGTGSQRDMVQAHIASGSAPNLQLVDWVDHDEMPLAWCASYINIWALRDVPLYYGTIPAKLYEAFAAGTPIAAAQGGEAAAILAESGAGLTVAPGDTLGFVEIIGRLLDDEAQRNAMSQRARAYAEAHFSFDAAAAQHEAVFLQAANSAKQGEK
jgi:colanic acid biosynthesis glycosyl transferase WcaI